MITTSPTNSIEPNQSLWFKAYHHHLSFCNIFLFLPRLLGGEQPDIPNVPQGVWKLWLAEQVNQNTGTLRCSTCPKRDLSILDWIIEKEIHFYSGRNTQVAFVAAQKAERWSPATFFWWFPASPKTCLSSVCVIYSGLEQSPHPNQLFTFIHSLISILFLCVAEVVTIRVALSSPHFPFYLGNLLY